ncbi:MAG: pantoate--beta-alanine ligase [Muribaculaceae bacterium]|nr:pantoate--beta-alanine ligase [Muribaculaceae bacterium]
MLVIRKVSDLKDFTKSAHAAGKKIGLVPTMGALHAGHLSLVKRAVSENDLAIASVFVNPTQFNNATDLATYPRDEKADFRLLEDAGIAAMFAPSVEEVYPSGQDEHHQFDLGGVAEVMEGKFRPGHFQGVAQIVSKLFRMTDADRAYFGEKDFQQIAVIRRMIETEGINIEIVACPIKREDDGLALSSRNRLLTPEQRMVAPGIHKVLKESVEYSRSHSVKETHDMVVERVNALEFCDVEYFEIVNGRTLEAVEGWGTDTVGCITVYCGKVRLIDNIRYR